MKQLILFAVGGLAVMTAVILGLGAARSPEVHGKATIEIARPPEVVYQFILDAENLPKWTPRVERVERISVTPLRYQLVSEGHPMTIEFFNLRQPQEVNVRMVMPGQGVTGQWRATIEPSPRGSRVSSEQNMYLGSVLWRSLALFLNPDEQEQQTLAQLKAFLEQQ